MLIHRVKRTLLIIFHSLRLRDRSFSEQTRHWLRLPVSNLRQGDAEEGRPAEAGRNACTCVRMRGLAGARAHESIVAEDGGCMSGEGPGKGICCSLFLFFRHSNADSGR